MKGRRHVACMGEMRNIYKILVLICDSAYFPVVRRCENFNERSRSHKLGRNPLDEGSSRRRDLYLTTNNTHKRKTCMLPAAFEPAFATSELPQTHALCLAATGIGDTDRCL